MRAIATLSLLLVVGIAGAQTIYKYSDPQGNVFFSDEPPPDATNIEAVPVAPAPTEQERRAAEAQAAGLGQAAGLTDAQIRAAAEEKRQVAEHRLREALDAFDTAQTQRPDDWQKLADGHQELKPSYFQRVEKAQHAVDRARKDIRALQP